MYVVPPCINWIGGCREFVGEIVAEKVGGWFDLMFVCVCVWFTVDFGVWYDDDDWCVVNCCVCLDLQVMMWDYIDLVCVFLIAWFVIVIWLILIYTVLLRFLFLNWIPGEVQECFNEAAFFVIGITWWELRRTFFE